MSLERMVIFAVVFFIVYHTSEARVAYMTAYREEKLRNSAGKYQYGSDTVWWEMVHIAKTGMVWMAAGQFIFMWVEMQPWFVR